MKKKIRTDKELLEILLSNIDKLFLGLCSLCRELYLRSIFTDIEFGHMYSYIRKHKPRNSRTKKGYLFYWEIGEKKPRIAWLKRQIKNCK